MEAPTGKNVNLRDVLIFVAIAGSVMVVFGPSLSYNFVNYDDPHYVVNNYRIHDGIHVESVRWAFTSGYAENWHPVTWLSHMLDFQLYGLNPGAHRLTNILLHIVSALALFVLLRTMTKRLWPSGAVAFLFAVHPLHVESVVWIAERKDVLSGLFAIATIGAYLRWAATPSGWKYGLLLITFALGLMAKSMLVTLPCVLLLLDYWPLKRLQTVKDWPRLCVEKIPLFALSIVFSIVTYVVQNAGGTMKTAEALPLFARVANAVVAYGAYMKKTIYPQDLAVLYPHPGVNVPWVAFSVSLATLIAISVAAWLLRRCSPYLLVGWLWFVGMLVPVIGIVQVGDQAYADRYTYLPLIGLFIAGAWGVADLWKAYAGSLHRAVPIAAASAIGVTCIVVASGQVRIWQNNITLFEHCVAVTTDNAPAYNNLGRAYHDGWRTDDAVNAYDRALAIAPGLVMARNNLALILLEKGYFDVAEDVLREAVALAPEEGRVHLNLGIALAGLEESEKALAELRLAVKLLPESVATQFTLGAYLVEVEEYSRAVPHLERALRLQPGHQAAESYLGRAREGLDDFRAGKF